eukprot:m.4750 g.4750  ORF g.4750 m.4750 type:complete len:182 (-) comp3090_c0_seq1:243-788(-)
MGNSASSITAEDLEDYQDCTFFSKKEILHVRRRFDALQPTVSNGISRLPFEKVESMPELVNNPFKTRMCEVFAEGNDKHLTFDDFLDMMSVFCEEATRDVKATYAFRIYDFDGDGYLGRSDLKKTLVNIVGSNLSDAEVEEVISEIMREADFDRDQQLSYVEFEHVVSRAPDFTNTFRIRL